MFQVHSITGWLQQLYLEIMIVQQYAYSDKLAHLQVFVNCQYFVAQMGTREDTLAHYLGAPFIDDVMTHNTLITRCF